MVGQALSRKQELETARNQIAILEKFRALVGQSSIPGLQRLVATALKQNCSMKVIIERILVALQGQYRPKNYAKEDIDLSILMYELGGGAAVYALNHSHTSLPSVDTIRPYCRNRAIPPCTRQITAEGILPNIHAMFGNREVNGGKGKVGHTLSFDEISIEARPCYINESDEIAGLCCEHVHELLSVEMGQDVKTVHDAAQAVRDGTVHMGKEATVGAISAHRRVGYDAKPVIGETKQIRLKENRRKNNQTTKGGKSRQPTRKHKKKQKADNLSTSLRWLIEFCFRCGLYSGTCSVLETLPKWLWVASVNGVSFESCVCWS